MKEKSAELRKPVFAAPGASVGVDISTPTYDAKPLQLRAAELREVVEREAAQGGAKCRASNDENKLQWMLSMAPSSQKTDSHVQGAETAFPIPPRALH